MSPDGMPSRFRWLDRWREPRWRAMLTWVVLARATSVVLTSYSSPIYDSVDMVFAQVQTMPGIAIPSGVLMFACAPTALFLLCWYQPLLLRVGFLRGLIWIASSIVLWFLFVAPFTPTLQQALLTPLTNTSDVAVFLPKAITVGGFLGVPGLATLGKRSRPWMSCIAGTFAAVIAFCLPRSPSYKLDWWSMVIASSLYGAVMLYGTDPLPRRPAERQLGEDQR